MLHAGALHRLGLAAAPRAAGPTRLLSALPWTRPARVAAARPLWRAAAAGTAAALAGAAAAAAAPAARADPASGTWSWSSSPAAPAPPLKVRGDPFDGLAVDPTSLASDPAVFATQLDSALTDWIASGRRGVWLKVPIEKAGLIEVAVARGFGFHHAEQGYVMLTRWLPTDCPSPLPANASTQVGVGAVVVNDDGKVLLLQEAVGPLKGRNIWKIPTGLLDAREDIETGVVREVREETGKLQNSSF